jgi:uncharacterized protein
MNDRFPNFIDPLAFADRKRQLIGEIALNKLARLQDALYDQQGQIRVNLSFSKNKALPLIQGTIAAQLNIECQRCLDKINLPLNVSIKLAVVNSIIQADTLSGEYDPFISTEKKISLNQLIEDELLLALPDFPRHQQTCVNYFEAVSENKITASHHPFSILAQLKNTGEL